MVEDWSGTYQVGSKNIDDRNWLKPVYGKYNVSTIQGSVKSKKFLPNLPDEMGH